VSGVLNIKASDAMPFGTFVFTRNVSNFIRVVDNQDIFTFTLLYGDVVTS
jgi:hypothetical protein